jgi:hypothetical protein
MDDILRDDDGFPGDWPVRQPEFYREVNAQMSDDVLAISCVEYYVVSRTKCGCWIAPTWDHSGTFKKFVLEGKGKRFAYPTREEARASFIIRKQREIQYAATKHDRAVRYLALAQTMKFGTRNNALHEIDTFDILLPEISQSV